MCEWPPIPVYLFFYIFFLESCLSPNITGSVGDVNVTNQTANSFLLEWEAAVVTRSLYCTEKVFSVPPLMYLIDVSDSDNGNRKSYETVRKYTFLINSVVFFFKSIIIVYLHICGFQYSTSLLVTGLNPLSEYGVRVRAKTEFFIGIEVDIPTVANGFVDSYTGIIEFYSHKLFNDWFL